MSHAKRSPSGAARWAYCPGSTRLIESRPDIVDKSGLAAELGTAAHELLEQCLLTGQQPETFKGQIFNVGNELQPKGFEADRDMLDAVEVATDFVWGRMREGGVVYPERKVNPKALIGYDESDGTADVTIIRPPRITISDYKHGQGILVEVTDNLQAILYGLGVMAEMSQQELQQITEVELVIIQPRASHPDGPVRKLVYPIEKMYEWAAWFNSVIGLSLDPNAPLVPGSKQCQWCPIKKHRDSCPALTKTTLDAFQVQTVAQLEPKVLRDVTSLTEEERTLLLDWADVIEQFIKAVKGQAQEDLQNGIPVRGQKLVRGQGGHRKFSLPDDKMIKKLSSSFGLKKAEVVTEPKLLGVKKVLGLAKKSEKYSDEKFEKLEALVERPPGKLTMAPESDPRPAAGSLLVAEAFKDIKIEADK